MFEKAFAQNSLYCFGKVLFKNNYTLMYEKDFVQNNLMFQKINQNTLVLKIAFVLNSLLTLQKKVLFEKKKK
jgi:hypothetical protein